MCTMYKPALNNNVPYRYVAHTFLVQLLMFKNLQINHKSLLVAQKNRCWLCGQFMNNRPGNGRNPLGRSKDHLLPRANGGIGKRSNMLFAHAYCNTRRGNRDMSPKETARARSYRLAAIAYQLAS